MYSKGRNRHFDSGEEGYHSLSSTQRTPSTPAEFSPPYTDGFYHCGAQPSMGRTFQPNHTDPISGHREHHREVFSPLDHNAFMNNSNNSPFDGRGILIERIKVAQNTIDSLSAKVFFYENEKTLLKEQKEQFEKGYYKLVQDNSSLLNDKITRENLLKKINLLGDEVSSLLKTQETLLEKHKEQQKHIEYYKSQSLLLDEENESLKKVSGELKRIAAKDAGAMEKLKSNEENVKNQCIVLNIEKETLSSELERLINKQKGQDEKLRVKKQKEQDLLKENSSLKQRFRAKDRDLARAEEAISFLEKQMKEAHEEKDEAVNDAEREVMAAYEDIKTLQEALSNSQDTLAFEKEEYTKVESGVQLLMNECQDLREKLEEAEVTKKSFVMSVDGLEKELSESSNQNKTLHRENVCLEQKLKCAKQENTSLSKNLKSKNDKLNDSLQMSEQKVKTLLTEIETTGEEFTAEKEKLHERHTVQMSELEGAVKTFQDSNSKLENELNSMREHWSNLNNDYMAYKTEQEACMSFKQQETSELKETNLKLTEAMQAKELLNLKSTQDAESLTVQLQGVQQENSDLHLEYQEKIKTIDQQLLTIHQLDGECSTLRDKNEENLQLIDMLNKQSKTEMLSQKAIYESKLSSLNTNLENVRITLRTVEQEKAICVDTYKKQIASLQHQADEEVEKLIQERDEINTTLQTANLDLDEYKMKFKGLQGELEDFSAVNSDLKLDLSLLSKELESYQQESQQWTQKDQDIGDLQIVVKNLRQKEAHMEIEMAKMRDFETKYKTIKQDFDGLKSAMAMKERELEAKNAQYTESIANLTKSQKEFQLRNDKLKTECRKRAMQSHATCGELEVLKAETTNVRKELSVVVELNKKLEIVNETLQNDNINLQQTVEQLQCDMHVLKTSYEDLLAKELSKQKSEFIMKENQLLKRLSNGHLDLSSSSTLAVPLSP